MVVFTCNHCGESLQKPRVEKHYVVQCRRPKSLTCVDCFKDFKNEEYTVHTKCITEEERYAAKGSIVGGIVKKGEAKQESWTDMIKSIVQKEHNLKPSLKHLFNTISTYSNVPRKKVKFLNFIKNSSGGRANLNDIEEAWNLIENYKNQQNKDSSHGQNDKNGSDVKGNGTKHKLDSVEDEPVKKKRKDVEEEANGEAEQTDKFSFKGTILKILNSKGSISCKKLQKKVLNAYLRETGNAEYTEKTIKKYNKKLKKIPDVMINDDTVSLITNSEQ